MREGRELRQRLTKAGWRLVRQTNHEVWRCPCGEHQITLAVSASDHRAEMNKKAQIRATKCPSLVGWLVT